MKESQMAWVNEAYLATILMSRCSKETLTMAYYIITIVDCDNHVDLLDVPRICEELAITEKDVKKTIEEFKKFGFFIETDQDAIYFMNPHMVWNNYRDKPHSRAFKRCCALWDMAKAEQEFQKLSPLNE